MIEPSEDSLYLAYSTESKVLIYDIENSKDLIEFDEADVSTIFWDEENKFIFFGKKNGTIK